MPDLLVNAAVAIIVGAASAFVSAKLGVRRAVDELKRTRAVERRLKWHEEVVEELHGYSSAVYVVIGVHEYLGGLMASDERERLWGEIRSRMDRLQQLSAGSGLFASVRAVELMEDLAVSFRQLGLGEPALDEPGRVRMDPDSLKAHFHQVREVMRALVDGHREEAGLEPLPKTFSATDSVRRREDN